MIRHRPLRRLDEAVSGRFLSPIRRTRALRSHPEDIRFEAKHDRQTYNALKRFPSLGAGTTLKGEDASSVVWSVPMAAQKVIGGRIDMENLDLPGVPEYAYIEDSRR
jgi:hypothetical protein